MVKEEKQENKGYVEFQVFSFTNKIRRLASHLELHKKIFHQKEVYEDFWENINVQISILYFTLLQLDFTKAFVVVRSH
jgi:ribosomal protein S15P/S13E